MLRVRLFDSIFEIEKYSNCLEFLGSPEKSLKTTFTFGENRTIEGCQQRDQRFQSLGCGQLNNVNESSNSVFEISERRYSEPIKDIGDNSQSYDINGLKCTETIASSLEETSVDLIDKSQYSTESSSFVLPQIKKESEDRTEEARLNNCPNSNNSVSQQNNVENPHTKQKNTNEYNKNSLLPEITCSSKSCNSSSNSIITARSTILCTSIMEINKAIEEEKQLKEERKSIQINEPVKDPSDSDDDVTFLPPDCSQNEPIEIDDDENDEITPLCYQKTTSHEEIHCKKKSSISKLNKSHNDKKNNYYTNTIKSKLPNLDSFTSKKSLSKSKQASKTFLKDIEKICDSIDDISSLEAKAMNNCTVLKWRNRIGTPRGTNLRFQLNEFNLIQIYERCPERNQLHTTYERPISERNTTSRSQEDQNPLLYLCRRCKCHGPATDFLAPGI